LGVKGDAGRRIDGIVLRGEVVDYALGPTVPGTCFFKDCAIAEGAPQAGGSIEIAFGIEHHAANGLSTVLADAKLMDDNLLAGQSQTAKSVPKYPPLSVVPNRRPSAPMTREPKPGPDPSFTPSERPLKLYNELYVQESPLRTSR